MPRSYQVISSHVTHLYVSHSCIAVPWTPAMGGRSSKIDILCQLLTWPVWPTVHLRTYSSQYRFTTFFFQLWTIHRSKWRFLCRTEQRVRQFCDLGATGHLSWTCWRKPSSASWWVFQGPLGVDLCRRLAQQVRLVPRSVPCRPYSLVEALSFFMLLSLAP